MAAEISVVVTLYNEDGAAGEVVRRSVSALEGIGRPWELILSTTAPRMPRGRRSKAPTRPTTGSAVCA